MSQAAECAMELVSACHDDLGEARKRAGCEMLAAIFSLNRSRAEFWKEVREVLEPKEVLS